MYAALPAGGRKWLREMFGADGASEDFLNEAWRQEGQVHFDCSPPDYAPALRASIPRDVLRATEELLHSIAPG